MKKETYTILETNVRLSESKVWEYQRNYFEQRGQRAWFDGEVPFYGTSNSFAACTQAELTLSLIEDLPDPKRKIRIIELGAGTGKFAHLFLCALERIRPELIQKKNFLYILTDFTRSNIREYPIQPALRPWFKKEILDSALYDLERPEDIRLQSNGSPLLEEPDCQYVFIANYVFDGVPQDLFEVRNDRLFEVRVCTTHSESSWIEEDPYNLGKIQIRLEERVWNDEPYQDISWNEILRTYRTGSKELFLSFPTTAIRCIGTLSERFRDSIFIICDKGTSNIEDLDPTRAQGPVEHGSISTPVNFHAIGQWARNKAWQVWEDKEERDYLRLNIYTPLESKFANVDREYNRINRALSLDDYVYLRRSWEKLTEIVPLREIISCLKISSWDPKVFLMFYDKIINQLDSGPSDVSQIEALKRGLFFIRQKNFFDTEEDVSFALGTVYGKIGESSEAASAYRESLERYGENLHTKFNLALCLIDSGQPDEGIILLNELRAKHPDLPIPARTPLRNGNEQENVFQ
ncbi:putative S-adenosyl-L-methionine-dependent methyltransferase [Leptospira broomii serovar Hurstbridge str. 5399]|uniref:S-adenosyl-L-methionine-dependent methyltransferase n=1 Tax=Leptospira broomii serovar Hurstbridge str. 5399 TaxID=1049789 RepID=T0GG39_9LEPT|nr:SAM-dependent methyltransferase [Leptospira broomii]EQA44363.1 putative S-adenosyl-L-methionine-dependent methyltransferase [Leptospira broomii serovar Hurstbridge str. 5399]